MRIRSGVVLCALTALMVCSCQKKVAKEDQFVKVGGTVFARSDFDSFMKMQRMYPSAPGVAFPGDRSPATFMVETEVLYRRAKWGSGGLKRSADWQWKKQ